MAQEKHRYSTSVLAELTLPDLMSKRCHGTRWKSAASRPAAECRKALRLCASVGHSHGLPAYFAAERVVSRYSFLMSRIITRRDTAQSASTDGARCVCQVIAALHG